MEGSELRSVNLFSPYVPTRGMVIWRTPSDFVSYVITASSNITRIRPLLVDFVTE